MAMKGHELEKSRVGRIVRGYATGGMVKGSPIGKPMSKSGDGGLGGLDIEGGKPKARLDRPSSRKDGGRTNVNVIVAPQGGGDKAPPPPMPMPAPAMAPPKPPMAPPMMPGAPPGAMPPGLGPRPFKRGGAVKRAAGGRVPTKMTGGGEGGLGRLEKAKIQKRMRKG